MTTSLYLMGNDKSGKTLIALGLAKAFSERGLKVGYFKPKGNCNPIEKVDNDCALLKEILKIDHPHEVISPFRSGPLYLSTGYIYNTDEVRGKIMKAFVRIKEGLDLLIIEGSDTTYSSAALDIDDLRLAADFQAHVLYITKIVNDLSLDIAVFMDKIVRLKGLTVTGHIFNNINRSLLDKTKGIYKPLLEKKGELLGIVPEEILVGSPTVEEYQDALRGEVLAGEKYMNRVVEDVLVGSMNIESALSYLRRSPNKAVITGGDRSDIALTALETSTSVLVLTGGLYPDVKILARAEEKKVPVILVHYDTYTTIGLVHQLTRHIKPEDEKVIDLAYKQVFNNCNINKIIEKLKLKAK